MSWDSGYPAAALLGLLLGALSGWWCPALIARIPEPEPEPEPVDEASGDSAGARPGLPPAPPKETYVHLAGLPGLARRTAAASALVGGVLGASVGWSWSLLFLLPLAPIGVALTVIDWRTTLLPTRLIAPASRSGRRTSRCPSRRRLNSHRPSAPPPTGISTAKTKAR